MTLLTTWVHRPISLPKLLPNRAGKVPSPPIANVLVQVLIALVVSPLRLFRIPEKKYVAQAHSKASAIHEIRDARNPNVAAPPITPVTQDFDPFRGSAKRE